MTLLQMLNDNIAVENVDAFTKISYKMIIRILIDLATVFVLVRFIYFPIYRNKEFFFMFAIFNLIIFLVSFLLNKVDLSMGAAFGLFAVFSMLRYRTDNISIKDMTYLFLCIAVGLVSAVTKIKGATDFEEYLFLGIVNVTILTITYLLESKMFSRKEQTNTIVYENIELIQSNRQDELLADIRLRTGINVHRVSVQKINFLKDSAQLKIYFYE
ncbi:MAG: hypothetical protein K0S53_445 [Bacteroidetes bacterium]|nr:hypothetical protein [Bacteroidota bacterium]MDF2453809.1 hypothetical protein [Bacteroidota bacterium]